MARPTPAIHLSPEQARLLQGIANSRETPHGLVQRAQMVLAISQGRTNKAIAQALGVCEETVGVWRKRWLAGSVDLAPLEQNAKRLGQAISALLADQPRPGCPATFTAEQVCQIIAIACEKPPAPLNHWTCPDLAREVIRRGIVDRISEDSVGRFLKSGRFKTSFEPILAEPRGG